MLLLPSALPCGLPPLTCHIHSSLFLNRRCTALSKFLDTQVPWESTEDVVLPHVCCVLSHLHSNAHRLLLSSCLSRTGRIKNPSCSTCGRPTQDTSNLILQCPATYSLASFCLSTTCGLSPGKFLGFGAP